MDLYTSHDLDTLIDEQTRVADLVEQADKAGLKIKVKVFCSNLVAKAVDSFFSLGAVFMYTRV